MIIVCEASEAPRRVWI